MKKSVLFFVLFLPFFCFSQVVDDFSDGDFTANPVWGGMTENFEINTAFQLHSKATATSTSYLFTPSEAINNAVWQCDVRINYNPSSSNYAAIYLISDVMNPANCNGYYVQIGNTTDEVSLYRQQGATKTKIIDGIDSRVNANPVVVTVKVTRDAEGNFTLYSKLGSESDFVTEGTVNDTKITKGNFFGLLFVNSGTTGNVYYFDNINVTGEVVPDNISPLWTDLSITSSNKLTLTFSEEMDFSDADFSLSPNEKSPVSTTISDDKTTVELVFADDFEESIYYTLTATGLKDLAGNALEETQRRVVIFGSIEVGDLVWNEVMFDNPSTSVEYVEIYNRSNKLLDLSGLQFTTVKTDGGYNTAVEIPAKTILEPYGYAAFCNDKNSLRNYFDLDDTASIFETTRWNALNNTGATLVLLDKFGIVFDEFTYNQKWHDSQLETTKGVSLERINPDLLTQLSYSWQSAAAEVNYGTPGYRNSQYKEMDDIAPLCTDFSFELPNKLILSFSKKMDFPNAAFVLLPNEITPVLSNISANGHVIELIFAENFAENIYYTLTANNLTDLSGNPTEEQLQRRFGITGAVEIGDLIWNEVMFDVASDGIEYVEIYNRSNKLLDLSGLKFTTLKTDGSYNTAVEIPAKTIIKPYEYVAFCTGVDLLRDYFELDDNTNIIKTTRWNTLNNTSATLVLLNNDASIIYDKLTYNSSWHNPQLETTKGVSLERINPDLLTQLSHSWQSATAEVNYGTPGYRNSQYKEMDKIVPSWIDLILELPNKLTLSFSKKMDFSQAIFTLLPDEILPVSSTVSGSGNVMELIFADDFTFSENIYYTLTISDLADLYGNVLEQTFLRIGIPTAAEEGDLVWNEVMFDAPADGVEYVEIANRSDKLLNLTGLSFSTVKSDGSYNTLIKIPAKTFIEPHGYAAFCNHSDSLCNYFGLNSEANIYKTEKWTSLNNTSATLVLLSSDEATVYDKFTYSAKWHHPLVKNPKGVSLERINSNLPTQDSNSWHSAASDVRYGTPGYRNSQFVENAASSDVKDKSVWLDSEVFSPDNDGIDDVCFIRYNVRENGYTANVVIFNAVGERVYQLAANDLISSTGFFTWDGKTNKGTNANVGVYVVYFQAINAINGKRIEAKIPVVVSAR